MVAVMRLPVGPHPHSRGENAQAVLPEASVRGSSPLAQGKPQVTVEGTVEEGLIPADAGKTRCTPRPRRLCPAHPRSRGENSQRCSWPSPQSGSSPLTRGKRPASYHPPAIRGLIPAHAGKTASQLPPSRDTWAHPRSRGENLIGVAADLSAQGSSPLTRGKQPAASGRMGASGLIPTHAGKTGLLVSTANHRGAHPRSHGGKR